MTEAETGVIGCILIDNESLYTVYNVLRPEMFVIDYLQLIKSDRYYGNRASEVGQISKDSKALARDLGVPVIMLSQLNRVSEQRETKEPTMSELPFLSAHRTMSF